MTTSSAASDRLNAEKLMQLLEHECHVCGSNRAIAVEYIADCIAAERESLPERIATGLKYIASADKKCSRDCTCREDVAHELLLLLSKWQKGEIKTLTIYGTSESNVLNILTPEPRSGD